MTLKREIRVGCYIDGTEGHRGRGPMLSVQ